MNVIENNFAFSPFTIRSETNYIVLHHACADICTIEDIDRWHRANGWNGVGYAFFVRKDGAIYRGRPPDAVGAQCYGYNSQSLGICAEGNYEASGPMPEPQKLAIAEVVREMLALYPQAQVVGHRDLNATACPGQFYPFEEIVALAMSAADPNAITITAGGQTFAGTLIDGTAYAPVRKLAEAMGRQVGWDGGTRTVTII